MSGGLPVASPPQDTGMPHFIVSLRHEASLSYLPGPSGPGIFFGGRETVIAGVKPGMILGRHAYMNSARSCFMSL